MYFWLTQRNDVNFLTKKSLFSLGLFFTILFFNTSANAVSISAYRIYLDEDERNTSFIIFNREANHQNCELSLIHNNFDEDSQLIHLPNNVIPENSAKDWIRYSPRKFVLTPAQSQTVRFSMRRKANAQDGEFRSYLLIDCGVSTAPGQQGKDEPQVSLLTRLVHSVPIIVRSGSLKASVRFGDFEFTQKGLTFSLLREGNRSVYGDIEVINKLTGKALFVQRNFSIYPESTRYLFTTDIKGIELKNLKFRYVENKDYGGDIIWNQDGQPH